ncbi:MAG TPA: hypothetical protein VNA88_12195 [Candidatus Kapabacteria bacterium]|nr:hypothetical protein [Candidatus Kapabacteria bacterium]
MEAVMAGGKRKRRAKTYTGLVKLREKELANGERLLYIDNYRYGKRSYKYLRPYLYGDPIADADTMRLACYVRSCAPITACWSRRIMTVAHALRQCKIDADAFLVAGVDLPPFAHNTVTVWQRSGTTEAHRQVLIPSQSERSVAVSFNRVDSRLVQEGTDEVDEGTLNRLPSSIAQSTLDHDFAQLRKLITVVLDVAVPVDVHCRTAMPFQDNRIDSIESDIAVRDFGDHTVYAIR